MIERERDACAEDKIKLVAELETVRTSLTLARYDLLSSTRRLQRAATECVHLRKERNCLSAHSNELETKSLEACKDITVLDTKNAYLSEELKSLQMQLDTKEREREDSRMKMREALAKELTGKRRLNVFALELDSISFKVEKLRECLGNALDPELCDFDFDKKSKGASENCGGAGSESLGESS